MRLLRKNYYVVLQDHVPSNPIAGVFDNRELAHKYVDELAEAYPNNVIELWPVTLNKKEIDIIHMIDADDK